MKKKVVLYGALALMSYLIFMVVLIPADRLYGLAKERLPFALYQLDGTLWKGSASVVTFNQGSQRLEAVKWELQPAALLMGRAQATVKFRYDNRAVSVTVGRSLSALYLHDFNGRMTAATIEQFSPPPAIGLKGVIDVDLSELSMSGSEWVAVNGVVRWRNAGLDLNNTTLGSFELTLTTVDGKTNGVVKETDGPLKVNGTLLLRPSGEYLFAGTVELRDKQRNDLRQGLRFIGTPNAQGVYTIKYQGQLPMSRLAPFAG